MDPALLTILRDPITLQPLTPDFGELVDSSGRSRYRIVDDVPILLVPERTVVAHPERFERARPATKLARTRAAVRTRLTRSPVSARNFDQLRAELGASESTPALVLVIGGGMLGFGMDAFARATDIHLVESDIYLGPRTQIVCDAHNLPFADGSFDGVVIQAVLEHVVDPTRVVEEIHRVLRPDGLLYSEVPFMQQVHEGPYDFTRWTLGGHRRLLRNFSELDAGVVGGAGEALAWSISYWMATLPRTTRGRACVRALGTAFTLPLRWSDRLLADRTAGIDAASGTYILARRAHDSRTDAEIIDAYRGAIPDPNRW